LTRFTELLAAQLAPHGAGAVAVAPGIVRSQMTESVPESIPRTPPEAHDLNAIRLRR
jgi:NAD(P)-dependent dehydrogenase (short-subunit alcohol dehydrogenase family)